MNAPNKTNETRPDELIAQIRDALIELRLPVMAEHLGHALSDTATEPQAKLGFIWQLIEPQLRARRHDAVERRVQAARFPRPNTLDDFDFGFQTGLDRDRVMQLATLEFVRRGQNLLVGGMSGTGKSHISIALGHLACAAGIRTLYTTSAQMLSQLTAAMATDDLDRALRPYKRADLRIVDELGLDRPERERICDAQLFYKVVNHRYDQQLSSVVTSNISWEAWGSYLGDEVATVAILDRLIHHGHLLNIEGPSYRAHGHARLNKVDSDKHTVGP